MYIYIYVYLCLLYLYISRYLDIHIGIHIHIHIQGPHGKLRLFLIACIYPCNGRTRPSKVPLETYRSHEDFDVF